MCRPDDFPPYYQGPRCASCGGDHFPERATHDQLARIGTFRDDVEAPDFTRWAREHYEPHTPINPLWHPLVIGECERINAESGCQCELAPHVGPFAGDACAFAPDRERATNR
jgi:hypothetical protein